jgi:hypothetical protein
LKEFQKGCAAWPGSILVAKAPILVAAVLLKGYMVKI